jgi:hypothetical protein
VEVIFDIDGRSGSLSDRVAELIAENLRCYAAGPSHRYHRDVEMLTRAGVDRAWVRGARAMADVMEDTLAGVREGPVPLDRLGLATNALMAALRLTGPASFDATSEHARLLRVLREAQAPSALV